MSKYLHSIAIYKRLEGEFKAEKNAVKNKARVNVAFSAVCKLALFDWLTRFDLVSLRTETFRRVVHSAVEQVFRFCVLKKKRERLTNSSSGRVWNWIRLFPTFKSSLSSAPNYVLKERQSFPVEFIIVDRISHLSFTFLLSLYIVDSNRRAATMVLAVPRIFVTQNKKC